MNRKGLTGAAKSSAVAASFLAVFLILVFFVVPAFAAALTAVSIVAPANNTFIYGTSVLLNASTTGEAMNVTFKYKNTTGTYTIATVQNITVDQTSNFSTTWDTTSWPDCTLGSICNITANASNSTDIDVVTTENANVTIDNTGPVLNTTTPANNSFIYGKTNQLFQVYVYDANLNTSNVTLNWKIDDVESYTPVSLTCYGSAPSFICNKTIDLGPTVALEGDEIRFYFEATDNTNSFYGSNGTATNYLKTTIDRTPPQYSGEAPNYPSGSEYTPSRNYGFQIDFTDNYAVSTVLFEHNFTGGSLTNDTATKSGDTYYVNFTQEQFANASVGYAYKWYANDSVTPTTDANWNSTSYYTYSFTKAGNPVNLYLNGSLNQDITLTYGATVNATGTVTGGAVILYRNGTDVTTAENAQNIILPAAVHMYTVNTTGNANYTANNSAPAYYATVNRAATTVTLYLNGTSDNKTIASGSVVNMTVTADNSQGTLFLYVNGAIYNETTGVSSIENLTTFSGNPGTEWNITGYYNQSQNYSAATPVEYYIKVENIPPTYTNLGTNVTNGTVIGKYGGAIKIYAQWLNTYALDSYWLYSNKTGAWAVSDEAAFTEGNWSNITIDPSDIDLGYTFQAIIYANDTSNNTNYTDTFQWTIDNTAPILDQPTPANASYISGSATELFQVYVDDNTLNTSNVTMHWGIVAQKYAVPGTWSDVSLTCYNLTAANVSFVCNNTVALDGQPDGRNISYYFEASDKSRLYGSNGTASSPLGTTIDRSVPQYSNNATNVTIAGKYDGVLIYAYWTDVGNLDTAILETNETSVAQNKTTAQYPLLTTFTGTAAWSNFSWSNSSLAVGTVVQWKIYANDSAGNQNVTAAGTFSIDNIAPTSSNEDQNVTNNTQIAKSQVVEIRAQWNDNLQLQYHWLETNATGADANSSYSTFQAGNWSNLTFSSTQPVGTVIYAKMHANDTSGNENVTSTWYYTIDNTAPTYTNNGTNVTSGSTIVKGTPIAIYALWSDNVALGQGWVQENFTTGAALTNTSITITSNWTNYTLTTSTLTAGSTYQARLFANDTSGNENYTVPTWSWTVDGTPPTWANESTTPTSPQVYAPGRIYIFNISWTDNLGAGNVSTVLLNFSGLAENQSATYLGASNWSVIITDLGFGNYTYKWYANDTSNNWNETGVYTFNITQNTTNPIDMYLINSTATYTNQNISISVGYTATINGTAVYGAGAGIIKLYSNVSGAEENVTNPYTTPTTLGAGVYTFKANTTGTVNYTSNTTATYYLTVTEDITPPVVLVYDYTNGTFRKSGASLTLNISVTDVSGVTEGDKCNITIGGLATQNITYTSGWCNGTITVPNPGQGNQTINITVADNSSNHNVGVNDSYVLTIDNTPPVITITSIANDTYVKMGADGKYWINGTVYDNLGMGSANVTINNTDDFTVYSFTGANNTAYSIHNSSALSDGYIALKVNYTDAAANTGEAVVKFTVDNTPPSAVTGDTTGTKAKSSTQEVNVTVTDTYMTNATIILHYWRHGSTDTAWQTKTMTGTPGTSTTYTTTIDTNVVGITDVSYYITGIDNATNAITLGGSAASPLGNFTIGATGTLDGYVLNINGSAIENALVSDGTRTRRSNSVGYYYIENVPIGGYVLTVTHDAYITNNSLTPTVTAGATTTTNVTLFSFNFTAQKLYANQWNYLIMPTQTMMEDKGYTASSTGNWNISKVFELAGLGSNYNLVYYYNGTNWAAFIRTDWAGSDLQYMNNTNDRPYCINMIADDRFEL